jgi:hypothetical protein
MRGTRVGICNNEASASTLSWLLATQRVIHVLACCTGRAREDPPEWHVSCRSTATASMARCLYKRCTSAHTQVEGTMAPVRFRAGAFGRAALPRGRRQYRARTVVVRVAAAELKKLSLEEDEADVGEIENYSEEPAMGADSEFEVDEDWDEEWDDSDEEDDDDGVREAADDILVDELGEVDDDSDEGIDEEDMTEEELMAKFERLLATGKYTFDERKVGDEISGTVISTDRRGAMIDVGGKGAATVHVDELSVAPVADVRSAPHAALRL